MYNIKVYDYQMVYKFTQTLGQIINEIGYSANTNGGQGRLNIELGIEIDKVEYEIGDFIVITEYPEYKKEGQPFYSGQVKTIDLIAENNQEKVNIGLIGVFELLNNVIYGGVITNEPKTIIENIITNFNTTYGLALFTTNISTFGSNITVSFSGKNLRECLDIVCNTIGWYWYLGADNILVAKPKTTNDHIFKYKNDIQSLKIKLNGENIVNRLHLNYSGGSDVYNDLISQGKYNVLEKLENQSSVGNPIDYSNNYFIENSDYKTQINIEINNKYLKKIKPGDTISILNSKYQVNNKQIIKMTKKRDITSLEIEIIQNLGTLGKTLFNN